MSRRSGSRWESRDRQHDNRRQDNNDYQRKKTPVQQRPPAISDEDAMKALLVSAESRSKERDGGNDRQRRGDGRDGGDSYKGRSSSRWGDNDKGTGSSKNTTSNEVSYYGPGGSANGSDNNNISSASYDRKRKRPSERDRERGSYESSRRNVVEDDNGDYGKSQKKGVDDDGNAVEEEKPPPEFKPNFGLSGALAKDTETGNMYKGVVLKFKEPPEARAPNTQWRFYVFKPKKPKGNNGDNDNDLVETLHVSKQSAYLLGRNADIADILLLHPSLSSQHAVLQYRAVPVPCDEIGAPPRLACQPYIIDLESTNGTFLNGVRIDAARYYQLKRGDVLTFGASTREYVLLTENTTSVK
jgi:smad nuclear-interacting protein 1